MAPSRILEGPHVSLESRTELPLLRSLKTCHKRVPRSKGSPRSI